MFWSTGDLDNAVHKVKIVRNPKSLSGKYITIDAVDVVGTLLGAGRIEQADTRLAYAGTWATLSASTGPQRAATGALWAAGPLWTVASTARIWHGSPPGAPV